MFNAPLILHLFFNFHCWLRMLFAGFGIHWYWIRLTEIFSGLISQVKNWFFFFESITKRQSTVDHVFLISLMITLSKTFDFFFQFLLKVTKRWMYLALRTIYFRYMRYMSFVIFFLFFFIQFITFLHIDIVIAFSVWVEHSYIVNSCWPVCKKPLADMSTLASFLRWCIFLVKYFMA